MKTKKALGIYVIFALLGVGLSSCSEEYVSRLPELIIKDMSFNEGISRDEQIFRNEDLSNYAISSSESWCVPIIDSENSRIIVSVSANETYDSRTAIVTITDMKDAKTRSFNVTQAQKNGLNVLSDESYEVQMEGGSVSISVESNVSYDVEIYDVDTSSDCEWITRNASTRGLETSTVVLNVAKNNSRGERDAIVRISNSEAGLSKTVAIHQKFTPIFEVDKAQLIEMDEFGGDIEIPITANINFDVYLRGSWMENLYREIIDDDHCIQRVHITPFTAKQVSRSEYIIIQSAEEQLSHNIRVVQYRPLFITESLVTIDELNSRRALDLYNRDDIEVEWSSSNENVVVVNDEGVIMGVGDGECIITVTSKDGKRTDSVRVIVNVPTDPTTQLACQWAYENDRVKTDSVAAVGCTFFNRSSEIVYMQNCALYNNGVKVYDSGNYASPGETVAANGGRFEMSASGRVNIDSGKSYWVEWTFECKNKNYVLRYDKSGEITVTQINASRRQTAASRRR